MLVVVIPLGALLATAADPPADPLREGRGLVATWLGVGGPWLVGYSLILAASAGIGSTALGTVLALAEARLAVPGARLLGTVSLLPLAVPSYLAAATLRGALSPVGWLGAPFGGIHAQGLAVAVVVLSIVTAPVAQLVVGAALARTSAVEEEAARTLGAGPWRAFRVATLPALRPALSYALLLSALYALGDFGVVAVFDAPVLTWRLYQAVASQDLARAAGLGLALIAVTLPLLGAARLVHGPPAGADVANPRPAARRRGSLPVLVAVGAVYLAVVGAGVVVPVVTLTSWVLDGISQGATFASPWRSLGHTLGIAAVGAGFTLLLAAAPAIAVGTRAGRLSRLIDGGVLVASALPGVLLAFGWILAALGGVRLLGLGAPGYGALLGSGVLLLLGYATRFLSEVYAPLQAAIARLDKRQHEAARMLGAPRLRVLRRVTLPAVTPGLAAGVFLGFVAILKELPVTLLLGGPAGLSTLAFRVWDRYNEALWHDAGAAGLLLLAAALASVAATTAWRRHA